MEILSALIILLYIFIVIIQFHILGARFGYSWIDVIIRRKRKSLKKNINYIFSKRKKNIRYNLAKIRIKTII